MCSDVSKGLPGISGAADTLKRLRLCESSLQMKSGVLSISPCCFFVFEYFPHFLYCAVPTTGISSITAGMKAWMKSPICVVETKTPSLLPCCLIQSSESRKVLFSVLIFQMCRYQGVTWLNETLVTRFMDQRWLQHSVSGDVAC